MDVMSCINKKETEENRRPKMDRKNRNGIASIEIKMIS